MNTPEICCQGKQRYDSKAFAEAIAKKMNRKDKRCSSYKCMACGGFHVGSSAKKTVRPQ